MYADLEARARRKLNPNAVAYGVPLVEEPVLKCGGGSGSHSFPGISVKVRKGGCMWTSWGKAARLWGGEEGGRD
jgi:hypothetical protein